MSGKSMRSGFTKRLTSRIARMPVAFMSVVYLVGFSFGIGFADGTSSTAEASGGSSYGPRWERDLVPITAPSAAASAPSAAAADSGSDSIGTSSASPTDSTSSTHPAVKSQVNDIAAGAPLGRFALDSSLLAHTRDDFADLRLFDAGGKAIGIHVRPVEGRDRRCAEEPVPMKRLSLQVLGDTAFEAVFLAEDPARLPDRIFISVEDRDFEISLSLWTAPGVPAGSMAKSAMLAYAGRGGWTPRLGNVPLFDYSRFVDLRREDARWPANPDRAVRLRVDGLTQIQRSLVSTLSGKVGNPGAESFQVERKLLRVDAISFSGEVCAEQRGGTLTDTVALPSPGFARPLRESAAKRSWFLIPAGRIPLKALLPRVGTRSFMRSVILTGWPDSLVNPLDTAARPWTWPRVAEARLHRIDWGGQADSSLRIPLVPSGRYAMLALGVSDNDDVPLILEGMGAEAERLEALFPLREKGGLEKGGPEKAGREKEIGADRYLLRYGDRGAEPLHFDFESLLESNPQSGSAAFADFRPGMPRILLEAPAPAVQASPFSWLTGQLVLTLGLALAIAGLMALVFLVARKAGKAEAGPLEK